MSKTIYPNNATRKLFGQAGYAMQRQNKRFISIKERLNKDAKNRELSLKESLESHFEQEQAKMRKLIKRIVIGFMILIAGILILWIFI